MQILLVAIAIAFLTASLFLTELEAQDPRMFVVSFISIGAGIDRNVQREFEDFLRIKYPQMSYEVSPAGYEGEGNYCFDLSSLSEEQQATFREDSLEILKKSQLVEISEQENCPDPFSAS